MPDLFIMEQVPGYISLGLQHTLDDLAALGFDDIRWGVVAASDAGCCHQRKRLFLTAAHPQGLRRGAAADPPPPFPARQAQGKSLAAEVGEIAAAPTGERPRLLPGSVAAMGSTIWDRGGRNPGVALRPGVPVSLARGVGSSLMPAASDDSVGPLE